MIMSWYWVLVMVVFNSLVLDKNFKFFWFVLLVVKVWIVLMNSMLNFRFVKWNKDSFYEFSKMLNVKYCILLCGSILEIN